MSALDSLPDEPNPDLCMCVVWDYDNDSYWRPCPLNLCEREDHDHNRCACERLCGDVPEDEDHRHAVCKGLRR